MSSSTSTSWMSLFIPVIPSDLMIDGVVMNNEMAFQHYFENILPMGKVERVDFISKPAHSGDRNVSSAFVHFSVWYDQSPAYIDISRMLETEDAVQLTGGVSPTDGSKVEFVSASNPSRRRFINIKINKSPIKRVAEIPKNIHQILNNYALMEGLIGEQNERITELKDLVARLRQTILEMELSEGEGRERTYSGAEHDEEEEEEEHEAEEHDEEEEEQENGRWTARSLSEGYIIYNTHPRDR